MRRKVSGMAVVERWLDRGDEDAAASHAGEDDLGSAADSEVTQAGAAGSGPRAERLNESDDPNGEPLGAARGLSSATYAPISRSRAVARGDRTIPDGRDFLKCVQASRHFVVGFAANAFGRREVAFRCPGRG